MGNRATPTNGKGKGNGTRESTLFPNPDSLFPSNPAYLLQSASFGGAERNAVFTVHPGADSRMAVEESKRDYRRTVPAAFVRSLHLPRSDSQRSPRVQPLRRMRRATGVQRHAVRRVRQGAPHLYVLAVFGARGADADVRLSSALKSRRIRFARDVLGLPLRMS